MPEGVGGWGDPMNWGIWLWLNPLDPENFEITIMLAATAWLGGMMLIECLDYATNPDYGKDFDENDPDGLKKEAAEAAAAAAVAAGTAKPAKGTKKDN